MPLSPLATTVGTSTYGLSLETDSLKQVTFSAIPQCGTHLYLAFFRRCNPLNACFNSCISTDGKARDHSKWFNLLQICTRTKCSAANTSCQLEGFLLPESLQWTLQGMECWILRVKLSLHSSRDRFFLQFAHKPPAEANDCWEKVLWFGFAFISAISSILIWVLDQQCSWQGRLLCQTAGADKQVLAGGTRGFRLQVWKTVKQSCHDVYIHIYIYTDIQNK